MPTPILKNQLIIWLKEKDYWLQYSGNKLLEGDSVSVELLDTTFNLFCEEYELKAQTIERAQLSFIEIEADEHAAAVDLKLLALKDILHVNALESGQSINIGANLTIVYGANGAGKTGYIRLLNNAFIARGDKQILPNVYNAASSGEPSCKFIFSSDDTEPYELSYPENKERIEFSQYAVFDSLSARVQLENDNKLNFTPTGFQFFDNLIEIFEGLKERLNNLIRLHRPDNRFIPLFVNDNVVRTAIINLGINSNEEELKALGTYIEENAKRHAELTTSIGEMRAMNTPKQIQELQALSAQFSTFIDQQQSILDCLSHGQIEIYKGLIDSYHGFQRLVAEEGIKKLEHYEIEKLGSNEWKEFIKAAKKYATLLDADKANGNNYPGENDCCLFCLQPVAEKENELINAYWSLLASQAENELAQSIQKIKAALRKLRDLPTVSFTDGITIYEHTKKFNPALANKWKTLHVEIETAKLNVISNLSNCNTKQPFSSYEVSASELKPLNDNLENTVQDLIRTNPERQIQELHQQLLLLEDKNLLSRTLNDVLLFVQSHKWAAKAEGCLVAFRTNTITAMQGALFTEHITERFTKTFASECALLKAPSVVEIVQKNVKMSTLRRLQVAGEVANRILSEGEQRSISLADFLTESQLNPHNKGIIFDDPVNSMDHERKELIAKRLVDLSATKQVIIFTHDLSFLIRLKIEAEANPGVHLSMISIRKTAKVAGIILQDIPWIAQTINKRIGQLKDKLVRVKKMEREGTEDEYIDSAKSWYLYLREAWERAVEERVFKGVIERFGFGVQTQKLQKVEVTPELLKEVEQGMTESSKWVHDSAAGLNPPTPDSAKLEADLNFLEAFANKCKAA